MNESKLRLRYIFYLILGLFFILFIRVIYLTYFNDNIINLKAGKLVQRGTIYDRRGIELALSQESSTIGIDPPNIYDPELTSQELAPILGTSPEKLFNTIREKQNYFLLKREIEQKKANQIKALALPGVRVEKEFKRIYPQGSLASSLIGFTGYDDDKALSGLETIYNLELLSAADADSAKGNNVHLTIDSIIQYRLEKSLGKAFLETQSKKGIGIIMDAETGKILAMASYPNFDPNHFQDFPPEAQTNWGIRHVYEPGSTMKIFIALMLLNEGAILPHEKFYCPGFIEVGKNIIRCNEQHGPVDLEEILQYSCNVGIIKASQKISDVTFHRYLDQFHFGKRTNFSLHEARGYLSPLSKWNKSTPFFYSIGQGLSVTPIQLITSAAAVINGGIMYEPSVVSHITNSYGELVHEFTPRSEPLGVKKGAAEKVVEAMSKAVTSGTGKKAYLENYFIAGKTGTAQKSTAGQGYSQGLFTASFLGFFPADKPKYVGLILFDEPGGTAHTGGGIAAPVFREVVESIIPIVERSEKPQNYVLRTKKDKQFKLDPKIVPDFTGVTISESLVILKKLGLPYQITGSGFVMKQEPSPGTSTKSITEIKLFLEN
ncbi:penicillin-binding protein 3 [Leptospira kobayashii]|uniref:Penicillin-binding protein 3 n=1 Tax=Leptospira kobayashii TaxID=1917830 RepID=A0ABN6K8L4_9LEPT|nr:penicillin-binding transpeptidase domain-containing protein [Leptospira kobayashii]BDA77278.1 penicillin-binding protein 3 [Leptospira kobayashii]